MTYAYGETLTWISRVRSGEDADGVDIWTVTETTLQRVPVWPRDGNGTSGNEHDTGDRDTVIVGYAALLPSTITPTANDRAQWRGDTYEIDGQPAYLRSPFTGWRPGWAVALKKVNG